MPHRKIVFVTICAILFDWNLPKVNCDDDSESMFEDLKPYDPAEVEAQDPSTNNQDSESSALENYEQRRAFEKSLKEGRRSHKLHVILVRQLSVEMRIKKFLEKSA